MKWGKRDPSFDHRGKKGLQFKNIYLLAPFDLVDITDYSAVCYRLRQIYSRSMMDSLE